VAGSGSHATPHGEEPHEHQAIRGGRAEGGRHGLHAVRSLSPLAAFGLTAALVLGGTGVASAANGGNFILGHTNSETTTSYLNNSNGTPLKLNAPGNAAPLKVSNSNLVSGLNAQFVNGMSPSQLATGGDGFTTAGTDTAINSTASEIVSTGALAAGTYYVNASALLFVTSGDFQGFCYVAKGSNGQALTYGGEDREGWFTAAETIAVHVNAGDTLQEWCYSDGTNGSIVYDAGITATRVLSSSGTAAASVRHAKATAPGAHAG
jgi:hypothetical protein